MNTVRTILAGGSGWIGSRLAGALPNVHQIPARALLTGSAVLDHPLQPDDVIVNAAGLRGGSDDEVYAANVTLVKELVTIADQAGCRLVQLGSAAEYGPDHESVLGENITPHPRSYYGVTKLIATEILQHWGHATVLRVFNIASSPPQPGSPLADVVARVEQGVRSQQPVELLAARTVRDWVSLHFIVDSVAYAVNTATPGVFNICSGSGVSMNDIAAAMVSVKDSAQLGVLDLQAAPSNTVVGDAHLWHALTGLREPLTATDVARIALNDQEVSSA